MQPTWQSDCGQVQLFLGDCRDILPHLGKVDACVTDPPYVLKHVDGGGFAAAREFYAGGKLDGLNDFKLDEYKPVLAGASDQVVAFHSRDQIGQWQQFLIAEFGSYDLHVWHKTNAIPFTCNTWKSDLEYIALGWRSKSHQAALQHEKSKMFQSSLCLDRLHPTCKPVPLMQKYVKVLLAAGQTCCDPFMGSAATGIACLRTGRKFIGIEINPKYFEIAKERIIREQSQLKLNL